jgi:hypothetical protein
VTVIRWEPTYQKGEQMSTEVAKLPEWAPYAGQRFTNLITDAAVAPGGEVVKGDLLIGVPFVTTAVTFRVGDYLNAATKVYGPYASIEIVTADDASFAKAVRRGRVLEDNPLDPEEELVFNEGGTGVYRQAVAAWLDLGWIKLPNGELGGSYGESILDTPLSGWNLAPGSPVSVGEDSEGNPVFTAPTRLYCKRGLRVSEYENEYTKEGRTRYFA